MSQSQVSMQEMELYVKNIGGIAQTTVEISPGTTILTGRNATNRTSLLQALMLSLGSEKSSLKADADEGHVELTIGDQTYTRTIKRQNNALVTGGDPYLDDATVADLFAFLLESNEARRAVARADNLRDIIMRPIDTYDIESQIGTLQNEREQIQRQISNIESDKQELPKLEKEKSRLESQIEKNREELAELEGTIDKKGGEIQENIDKKDELEAKLAKLRDTRGELERVRDQIHTEEESINALHDEQDSIETELADIDPVPDADLTELDNEIARLRSRRMDIDNSLDQLQTIIQFNQNLLDKDLDLLTDLQDHPDNEIDTDITDKLLAGDDLTCWTCGSEITTDQVETMLDRFQHLHAQYMSERGDLDEQISSLKTDQRKLQDQQRQREQLQSRKDQITAELKECQTDLAQLETRRDDLVANVETLESEVEELRSSDEHTELIDLHKKANEFEVEIEQLETELADVTAQIDQLEEDIKKLDQLRDQHEEIQSEIEALRTKIDRIEQAAIGEFNEHMESLLQILEYDNLERIWLERTEREDRDGRRKVTTTNFDMHVVRSTPDGTVFEDDISHLSESEREVTGLVFALAGYLAHDLHEDLPVMLIDSVEAIDPTRIEILIEYFTDYPEYLVVALLEDDAQKLDEGYQRITDI